MFPSLQIRVIMNGFPLSYESLSPNRRFIAVCSASLTLSLSVSIPPDATHCFHAKIFLARVPVSERSNLDCCFTCVDLSSLASLSINQGNLVFDLVN